MTSTDGAAMPSAGQWDGLRASGDGVAAHNKEKRAKPPVSRGRRLLGKGDILDAVAWRLSGWQAGAIDTCTALVSQLIQHGVPLDDAQPDVVAAMASFPRERRDAWSALCALAVLIAKHHRNRELFYTAGLEVVTAHRQANRAKPGAPDELSKLIAAHLADDPDAHPDILFNTFADQAWQFSEVIVDFNPSANVLVVQPQRDDEAWIDVGRAAFRRRVQREKRKFTRQQPADVAAKV